MKDIRFEEWVKIWLEEKKVYVKESTYANYSVIIKNQLLPNLGGFLISEITKEAVQEMIIKMRTKGRLDARGGLSEKTVKDIIIVLKMCLKDYGVQEKWLYTRNSLQYPIDYSIRINESLGKTQYQKIIEAIRKEGDCEAMGYAISLYTGMRIGEICALQWKDVDMEQKSIYVSKTLQRIYYKNDYGGATKIIISTPKSKAAIREIPISKSLEDMMQAFVTNQNYFLLSGSDKYIEPRLYRKHFTKFLARNDLEHVRFHDLRHTFATRCIEKGGDYKTVSCILGHSSVSTTLNRYVHPQMEIKRKCVELI